MEYYLTIIELFEPWTKGLKATIVTTLDGRRVADISTVARARLETLIRLYYLRHSFDSLDSVLIMFLLLMGSITVHVLADSVPSGGKETKYDTRPSFAGTRSPNHSEADTMNRKRDASTLLLCAKGLADQGQNLYLSTLMFNVLTGLVASKMVCREQRISETTNSAGTDIGDSGGGLPSSLMNDLECIRIEAGRTPEVRKEYIHMDWPVYTWVHPENERFGRLLEAGSDVEGVDQEEG